jgi:hypothetical protein
VDDESAPSLLDLGSNRAPGPGAAAPSGSHAEQDGTFRPGLGAAHPIDEFSAGSAEDVVQVDQLMRKCSRRHPEDRSRSERGHRETYAVLVAVVSDRHRPRRQAAGDRPEPAAARRGAVPVDHVERLGQADDDRERTARRAEVDARREPAEFEADVRGDVGPEGAIRTCLHLDRGAHDHPLTVRERAALAVRYAIPERRSTDDDPRFVRG